MIDDLPCKESRERVLEIKDEKRSCSTIFLEVKDEKEPCSTLFLKRRERAVLDDLP